MTDRSTSCQMVSHSKAFMLLVILPCFTLAPHLHAYNPRSVGGPVRVVDGSRYLRDKRGRAFYPILAARTGDWFAKGCPGLGEMRSYGQNSVWCQIERVGYLEETIGEYNTLYLRKVDSGIRRMEKMDIYFVACPFDVLGVEENWTASPYNRKNGGPLHSKHDMWKGPGEKGFHEDVLYQQKKFLEFCIRRWGKSPALLAWDVGSGLGKHHAWSQAMAEAALSYQKKYFGAVIKAITVPFPFTGKDDGQHLPQAACHFLSYHNLLDPFVVSPENPFDCIIPTRDMIARLLTATRDRPIPILDLRSGPANHRNLARKNEALDDACFHNLYWTGIAAGLSGTPTHYPWGKKAQQGRLSPAQQRTLRAIAAIVPRIDWNDFRPLPAHERIFCGFEDIVIAACADDRRLLAWFACTKPDDAATKVRGMTAHVVGLADGRHDITIYHDRSGDIMARMQAKGETLDIAFPPFLESCFVVVHTR